MSNEAPTAREYDGAIWRSAAVRCRFNRLSVGQKAIIQGRLVELIGLCELGVIGTPEPPSSCEVVAFPGPKASADDVRASVRYE